MSEVTFSKGDIHECPYCTLKHITDATHHADFDQEIKQTLEKIRQELKDKLSISNPEEYDKVRKYEHILEDYLTVLRNKRKEYEHQGCSGAVTPQEYPTNLHITGNPDSLPVQCIWRKEERKPKEYFHPESFRTLCPECPMSRCALCPPELACATRIIIGCPKELWDEKAKKCMGSTEVHVIYHGSPKPK